MSAACSAILVAPFFRSVLRFFPPIVTGTIITMIGFVLIRVGVNWAGGGAADGRFRRWRLPRRSRGFVLAVILIIIRFGRASWPTSLSCSG